MSLASLFILMATHFVAVITPGPDVFLVLRTSLAHGFKHSVFACIGVGIGIVLWVILTAFGLKTLFALFPSLQIILMIFSVCYLSYLSFLLFKSAKSAKNRANNAIKTNENDKSPTSAKQFLLIGLLTNLSNPKAILYFASIFSRFVEKTNSFLDVTILVSVISIESVFIFIAMGWLFSTKKAREKFLSNQHLLDGICSAIFGLFALIIFYELIIYFLAI
ncbi:LysE family translocator [Campylobacter sp. faydin G-105]|uniref:LysE family translocator n=1 Tax=Campylobacter anatolicus TaxID=2829105 RepID=UPI001BA0630B|nr:LysE family translocator [Campylobacter anatolicus]MBR8462812.1 LysE family translocator [Campylobacter anatolicus]